MVTGNSAGGEGDRPGTDPVQTLFPKKDLPFFDADGIGKAIENRYVAWLDLMGAKGIMGRSLSQAANYIGKIHIAALETVAGQGLAVFPVIDGCYIVADGWDQLQRALSRTMLRLTGVFMNEAKNDRRFLVRGGIAAGRVVLGEAIAACSNTLKREARYSACLAIGTAIGQAYAAEAKAAPFGFWVDITARTFRESSGYPFTATYWRWLSATDSQDESRRRILGDELMRYFDWAEGNRRALEYDPERLAEHRAAATEYYHVGSKES